MSRLSFTSLATLASVAAATDHVAVSKNGFAYKGDPVFLSGVNQAWISYGNDFGNDQGKISFCPLNSTLEQMKLNGGHVNRIWLHVEGDNTPVFDSQGMVVSTDTTGSLIPDLRAYLQNAAAHDVFVQICLWNGAVMRNQQTLGLYKDVAKLQSYVQTVLAPMAEQLSNETALIGFEIINEPEGSVALGMDDEPCFDTSALQGTGAGWNGHLWTMRELLTFVSVQTAAIHQVAPQLLVTVGSWSEKASTDNFGYFNYYKDECLKRAFNASGLGSFGSSAGFAAPNPTLDYFQVHSYAFNGKYNPHSPFLQHKNDFGLSKPLVVGEFSQNDSSPLNITAEYETLYGAAYDGAWSWTAEPQFYNFPGMAAIQGKPRVPVAIGAPPLPDRCACSDIAPDKTYTCAQQAGWGKCDQQFMQGYCCRSCHQCQGCT